MKIEHIAIVYKKSVYQKQVLEAKTTQPISKLIEDNHPSVRKILPSHHKHLECLEYVQDFLTKEKIEFSLFQRNQNFDESTFDLILSVGGDGTFLDASKNVSEKYMLGVNSCPNDSVGRFSAAYKENFSDFIRDIISDQIKPTVLTRLSVRLQGKTLIPALNDVL
ncbi:MAG: NAD(+)/NADH kinase, partial [Bdellovibrionales bacterium]|nr:NAD(+)/NADH kinase [Bdellovibrionales bacterium]